MNKKTRKLFTWCLVVAMVVTQMLFTNVAFAATRNSGTDRYKTAIAISQSWTSAENVVIAGGYASADALSAAPFAYAKNAPILLTDSSTLSDGVLAEIQRLNAKNVYIVGGTGVVSADIEAALKAANLTVDRISGADRYATSLEIAKKLDAPTGVVVANGYADADALSVSSIAAYKGMAILLTPANEVSADAKAYIGTKTVYAVGGNTVLSDAVVADLKATRLSGADRYATNVAVLGAFSDLNFAKVYVATGEESADALAGSVLAAKDKAPVVLVGSSLADGTKTFLTGKVASATSFVVFGGAAAVADSVVAAVEATKPATPDTLTVESVSATNLKEVVVKFNKAVDEDTVDAANFDVAGQTIKDAVLADDDKTVTIKLTTTLSNDEDYDVTVKEEVKDVDGNAITEVTKTVSVQDVTLPEVTSAKFTGPQTVELTFSEPVDPAALGSEITIDDNTYSATVQSYDWNKVTIDLGTELSEGSHNFKIKGFADFMGYKMVTKTMALAYVDVTDAPTVTIDKASQSTVTLKFNRPVKGIDATTFYQTYSSWKPLEVQDKDGNVITDLSKYYDTVKLIFVDSSLKVPTGNTDKDRPLPTGTAKIVVLKEGDNEKLQDKWGNNLSADVTLNTTISADNDKPSVTKVEVKSESEVKVYFSEDVKTADAQDKDNIVIKDSDGEKISSAKYTLTYTNTDDEYILDIKFGSALDTGNYTMTLEAIEDVSLAGNALDTVTKDFVITDKTGVDLSKVKVTSVAADRILYVDFGEAMSTTGTASVLNKDNYLFGTTELDDDVKVTMFTDDIVKMQFPVGTDFAVAPYTSGLTIGRVADAAGNLAQQISDTIAITAEVGPVITEVTKVDENKLELKLDKELKSVNASGIEVSTDSGVSFVKVASISFVNDADDTIIKVTVPDSAKDDTTKVLPDKYLIRTVTGNIKSITGASMATKLYGSKTTVAAVDTKVDYKDGLAPKIVEDKLEDAMVYASDKDVNKLIDTITITYSEDINPVTVSKYTYEVSGYDVKSVAVLNNVVTITLDEETDNIDDLDASPSVTQAYDIEDMAGNAFKADAVDAISAKDAVDPARK